MTNTTSKNISENILKILVIGSHKNGKSTLVNSLLGKRLLPADYFPHPPIINEVKYGNKKAVLHLKKTLSDELFNNLPTELQEHISRNKKNNLSPLDIPYEAIENYVGISTNKDFNNIIIESPYEKLELFYPSNLLKYGIEFTEISYSDSFVNSHEFKRYVNKSDVVFLVLSAGAVLSRNEMILIKNILNSKVSVNIFFIVNKMDIIRECERTKLINYTNSKIHTLTQKKVYFISASEALNAKEDKDKTLFEKTGIIELQKDLLGLITKKQREQLNKSKTIPSHELNNKKISEKSINYKANNIKSDNSTFHDHILFIEHLIEKYKNKFNSQLFDDLSNQLNYIKEKQQDKLLNLSVIGNFSTGKSTLINALLKRNLLETKMSSSTTTASTIIEHSNFFGINVHYSNKNKPENKKTISSTDYSSFFSSHNNIKKYKTVEELKEKIKAFGALSDKSKSNEIKSINVYLPAPTLKGVFRIIDTPGLDASDAPCLTDITKYTIENISDASIIVIKATEDLPMNWCLFIKNNLSNVLSQSVFVVTMLNQIDEEKEREEQLEYLKKKIEFVFKIKNPLVLPYYSLEVLKKCRKEGSINQEYLATTLKSEKELLSFVRSKKSETQTKKLVYMIEKLYSAVNEQINSLKTSFEKELSLLERSKQYDLSEFVNKQKEEKIGDYLSEFTGNYFSNYKQTCDENAKACMSGFYKTIDGANCDSVEQFKTWWNSNSEHIFHEFTNNMLENCKLSSDFIKYLNQVALDKIGLFKNEFKNCFKKYDLLEINFDSSKLIIENNIENVNTDFGAETQIVNKAVEDVNLSIFGGALSGSFIGSAIGLITLGPLGGLLGYMAGMGAGGKIGESISSDIKKVKRKVKKSLKPKLKEVFTKIADEFIGNYKKYVEIRCNFIKNELNKYLHSYQAEVERRIIAQENKRKLIEKQIGIIKHDLKNIDAHKKQILGERK